jgi:hypothetical protein
MKMSKVSTLLLGSALLFSSAALAGVNNNKGKLTLAEKIVVAGKPLDPGNYNVEWSGSGPTVQVTLLQGKQTVATLPAHLTEEAGANPQDAYSTTAGPDGSKALTAIYPSGKRIALEFEQAGAQAATQSN